MSQNKEHLLLIFTRNPELGKVKSRLAADIGEHAALEIYNFLLEHTHKITKNLPIAKEVWYSNEVPQKDLWNEGDFYKKAQQGIDLGERMLHAFEKGFNNGYKYISIIGSDMFDIDSSHLQEAFSKLERNDAVIGPATDGGFYYLGLSKPIYSLFANKDWGTDTVFKSCMHDLKNYQTAQLSAKNDVDYLSDIKDIDVFKPFLSNNKKLNK